MPRYAQAKENVPVDRPEVPAAVVDEVERLNDELDGRGRVLVRPSGTEPLVRVLAEAERAEEAQELCASIARLVRQGAGSQVKALHSGRPMGRRRRFDEGDQDVRDHRLRRAP